MPRHSEERGTENQQRKETTNVWAIVKIHLSKKHMYKDVRDKEHKDLQRDVKDL